MTALALLGCARAAEVVVRDDRGTVHRLPAPAQRIVSLLPSLTESVCALGACNRLVGVDRFSNHPTQVQALPKLGGLEDVQVERVVALKPDVVLAARSARLTDRLEALGLKVVLLEPQTHADVQGSLIQLAALLGMPQEGERLWAAIDRDINAAAAKVPAVMRGRRVYFEVASAPYAAGPASFLGETLLRLGMGNVVPAELGVFPKLNPEFVLRQQPDIIMASQREAKAMAGRPGWQGLRALATGQVCAFEAAPYDALVRPGPRLGEAALVLANCLVALPPASGR
jgi:iron complex transport system substrate-binding protein